MRRGGLKPKPLAERFWASVDVRGSGECWPWKAGLNMGGYGQTFVGSRSRTNRTYRNRPAHRVAYMLVYGEPPVGMLVRHLCGNRRCCNPAHLETGTPKQNTQDAIAMGTLARGEKAGAAKLSPQEVIAIRNERMAGLTLKEMAARHGIGSSQVSRIARGVSWKHLLTEGGAP